MVSELKLIAEPVEVLPRPEFARELAARFRARSCATAVLVELALVAELALALVPTPLPVLVPLPVLEVSVVVPATAWVDCVPLTAPPAVLTYRLLSVSGFCQYSGATSMTT